MACMYTTLNLVLAAATWAWHVFALGHATVIGRMQAFVVFNTLLTFLCTTAMALERPVAYADVFRSVGIHDPRSIALTSFAIHVLPMLLMSAWYPVAAEHPWMLLAPLATALAYACVCDTAWIYGENVVSGECVFTALVMYAVTLVVWVGGNAPQ